MAQLTIYISDEVADRARRAAKRTGQSLSAYVSDLLRKKLAPEPWPKAFVALLERGGGDIEEPPDPPPEDVEPVG